MDDWMAGALALVAVAAYWLGAWAGVLSERRRALQREAEIHAQAAAQWRDMSAQLQAIRASLVVEGDQRRAEVQSWTAGGEQP